MNQKMAQPSDNTKDNTKDNTNGNTKDNTNHNLEKNFSKWQQMVQDVLKLSQKYGASSAEVTLATESGINTTVRLGEVETIEFNRDKSLSITVYNGQKKGTAATTDFQTEALAATVQKACKIATYTEADPFAGLPDKDTMARTIPDLNLYHPIHITPEASIQIAKECEAAGLAHDKRIINSEGASFSSHTLYHVYGNTLGFLGAVPSTKHSLSCVLVGSENSENNAMERDYDYTVARDFNRLDKATEVGIKAASRTLRRLSARKISTRQAPVIFEAPIAKTLWSHLISALSGSALYRKSSFLLDTLGTKIFPDFLDINENPHLKDALGSAPFDSEGVATKPKSIVQKGILSTYLLSTYSARKLGLKTTGHAGGVHNLMILPTHASLSELLKTMDTGLLVTEVMGQGVNIVTGDYSRGAAGFWVEKGELAYPVHEITIASNLKAMFEGIVGVAEDVDNRSSILTGSVLIDSLMIGGT